MDDIGQGRKWTIEVSNGTKRLSIALAITNFLKFLNKKKWYILWVLNVGKGTPCMGRISIVRSVIHEIVNWNQS